MKLSPFVLLIFSISRIEFSLLTLLLMLFQNVKIRKMSAEDKSFFLKSKLVKFSLGVCLVVFALAVNSCRTPPKTEMRSLLPNNAVAYLETNDLAKTLKSLTDSPAFQQLAHKTPNFSALENMQIAVAVTGFETIEENAALNIKPQFVAVAETHAWSWQTISFAENQLDAFVRKNYGDQAKLETSQKNGGKIFTWTANDNRRFFAFVQGSLIYLGTDAAAIENCSAIKSGEAESLIKHESLSRVYTQNNLVFGYVSLEGVNKIADFAGVKAAVEMTEESGGRTFIAGVLPQILQNTTREIIWTANKTELGIEDNYIISLVPETSSELKETLSAGNQPTTNSVNFLPADFFSATRYNLKSPLIAWRSLLLSTAKNTDALSRNLLIQFSDNLLEPYGVSNAETFLSSIDSEIITVLFDEAGDRSAAIVTVKDKEKLKKSVTKDINFQKPPIIQENAEIWLSGDKNFAAAFIEYKLILGERESVLKCLQAEQSRPDFINNLTFRSFASSVNVAATFAKDVESAEKIVEVLAQRKDENRKLATFYLTETRFTENGIERRTISDFGLIGIILKQMNN